MGHLFNLTFAQGVSRRVWLTFFPDVLPHFPVFLFSSSCSFSRFSFISVSSSFSPSPLHFPPPPYIIFTMIPIWLLWILPTRHKTGCFCIARYEVSEACEVSRALSILNKLLLTASKTLSFPEFPSVPMATPSKFSLLVCSLSTLYFFYWGDIGKRYLSNENY